MLLKPASSSSSATRTRKRPAPPPIALPKRQLSFPQFNPPYPPYDSIEELEERVLDLGADWEHSLPSSSASSEDGFLKQLDDVWGAPRVASPTSPTLSRRGSTSRLRRRPSLVGDRDCGICFEQAVQPLKTLCCGRMFCREHLSDWLTGLSSQGRCPTCDAACSIEQNTLSLSSPTMKSFPSTLPLAASPKCTDGCLADTAHPVIILAPSPRRPPQQSILLSAPESEEEDLSEEEAENQKDEQVAGGAGTEEADDGQDSESSAESSESAVTPLSPCRSPSQSPSPLLLEEEQERTSRSQSQSPLPIQAFLRRVAKSHGYHRSPGSTAPPTPTPTQCSAPVSAVSAAPPSAESKSGRTEHLEEVSKVLSMVGLSVVLYVLFNN